MGRAETLAMVKPKSFFVIAHNIRSLYNVGSIFRTADAFGAAKIYLTGYTGTPEGLVQQRRIAKSALGAEKFVPWEYYKSPARLIRGLKEQGIRVVALENHVKAKKLAQAKIKRPLALVLGEETKGVPKPILSLCDEVWEIPMYGQKESLNVAVAFGIAAYQIQK